MKVVGMIFVSILLAGAIFLGDFLVNPQKYGNLQAAPVAPIRVPSHPLLSPAPPQSQLGKVIQPLLNGADGTYGIVIKNLKTDEQYLYNDDHPFTTASLYKLWVMGAVFDQEKKGNLADSDVLSADAQTLNNIFDISDDEADVTEGTISSTVKNAVYKMITISDNPSALLLSNKIGLAKIADFMRANGLLLSNLGEPPEATPSDIALFFEKLYHKQLVDPTSSEKMLALLKEQQINDRIPQYLPAGTVVAHKTGELDTFKHDAGIVYTSRGNYVIVLMSDTPDPATAASLEAKISQAVYAYFTTEKKK